MTSRLALRIAAADFGGAGVDAVEIARLEAELFAIVQEVANESGCSTDEAWVFLERESAPLPELEGESWPGL